MMLSKFPGPVLLITNVEILRVSLIEESNTNPPSATRRSDGSVSPYAVLFGENRRLYDNEFGNQQRLNQEEGRGGRAVTYERLINSTKTVP